MAITETARSARSSVSVGSLFSRLVATVTAWNDTRVTRNALSRLSDRELDDIGLSRGDIESAIR